MVDGETMTDCASGGAALPAAQSTVQLFEQLCRTDYGDDALRRVRDGCAVASELFAGRMHACGKPYLAHCTASASALAALAAEPDVVLAGLLHGAYRWGDFGPWRELLRLKRAYLRRRLGEQAERYVFAFHTFPWNLEALTALRASAASFDADTRRTILLRLVSDLDNIGGGALHYRADSDRAVEGMRARGPILVELAERIGFPVLAAALAAEVAATFDRPVSAALRTGFSGGALLPPLSARRRLRAVLGRAVVASARGVRGEP
jgi:hypothetical protein